jgi:tRNA A-37 threonylcarbamoyl transferase component Bud32
VAITRAQLVERLNHTGLLPAAEVEALEKAPAPNPDGAALAAELVRQQKLTSFQAEALAAEPVGKINFGEHTAQEKVGEGGMGVVYKAQHRRLKRTVAIKVLHPNITKSEDAVRRFRREVEASARLSHPNIVAAYDANQEDGVHYLVMEYVQGIDLFHLVKNVGPLSAERAIDYILQAARGLEHAHERGVVHRDIKPSNLLLDSQGTVKILDMGLVRLIDPAKADDDSTGSGNLTQTGEILGSFDYMAPEQAIDTKRVDHRADVYGLGCTLYYLLCGRAPYRGETSMQKLLAHREMSIPSLRALQPDIPLALDAVFHRMLAKKPDDRYSSMLELIRDLEACKPTLATKTTAQENADAALERSYKLVPSHLIICGTLCVLAVIAGNVFLSHQAAANDWRLSEDLPFVKWYGLLAGMGQIAGMGMVATGVVMSIVAGLGERFLPAGRIRTRPGRMARVAARWMLAVLAGSLVGAIGGAGVGIGLASHTREEVRIIGGVLVGAIVGAALGGWRSWVLILGCAVAGFFVGSTIHEHSMSLIRYGVDYELKSDDLALMGFGIVGLIVGAVVGARLGAGPRGGPVNPRTDRAPAAVVHAGADGDANEIGSNETVRRVQKRS